MKRVYVVVDNARLDKYRNKHGFAAAEYKTRMMLIKNGFDLRYHISMQPQYQGKYQTLYEQDAQIIEAGEAAKHAKNNGGKPR